MNLFIKQKFISIGDKYNVTDSRDQLVYKAKSRVISPFLHKKYLQDANGNTIMTIQRKIIDILPNYIIKDANGNKLARVQRRFSFGKSFNIIGYGGGNYAIKGDFFAWNFQIYKNGGIVGSVSKKIIHLVDQYHLQIDDPNDAPFFLACVIAIDNLCHNGSQSGN